MTGKRKLESITRRRLSNMEREVSKLKAGTLKNYLAGLNPVARFFAVRLLRVKV